MSEGEPPGAGGASDGTGGTSNGEGGSAGEAPDPTACFDSEILPLWTTDDLAAAWPGASRPLDELALDAGEGVELCGWGTGLGAHEDSLRYALQRRSGDFELTAPVFALSHWGAAGLMVRRDERRPSSAFVAIVVSRNQTGGLTVQSSHRAADGAVASFEEPKQIEAGQLPITLRIERAGNHFRTFYGFADGEPTESSSLDLSGSDLATPRLQTGLVQFTTEPQRSARAEFGASTYAGWKVHPGLLCFSDLTLATAANSPVRLSGHLLDSIRDVRIAGVEASIASRTSEELILELGEPPPRRGRGHDLAVGPVVVRGDSGEHVLRQSVLYGGRPYVRGDVNEDGQVNVSDLEFLRLALSEGQHFVCPGAADVNGDGNIDEQDLGALGSYLSGETSALAAPFPEPGVVPGGLTCGIPEPPGLVALTDEGEQRLTDAAVLAEGDVVRLVGERFPSSGVGVLFDDVLTEVLESSETELMVRIGQVPSAGTKCPVIFEDLTQSPDPSAGVAFGLANGIASPALRPELCPTFTASPLEGVSLGSYDREQRGIVLHVDRNSWAPDDLLDVRIRIYLPPIDGVSRGSRLVRFSYQYLQPSEGDPITYEAWLEDFARAVSRELHGGPGCGCDVNARVLPESDSVLFSPCGDLGSFVYPIPPDPPQPEHVFPLKPLPPPLWGSTIIKTTPVSCSNPTNNPRTAMWCAFEVFAREFFGHPVWEYSSPLSTVYGGPHLPDPNQRTPDDKFIMFSTPSLGELQNFGYTDPCAIAARAFYCGLPLVSPGQANWMPPLNKSARVLKTFWLTEPRLPVSADPNDYYSYQPLQGGRQYLAGIHLALSTGVQPSYFTWGTFWVPKPAGDTTRKDGSALYYNDICTQGHGADRPAEMNPAFSRYVMCTDSAPGEEKCGNPWAPPNECVMGCNDCHVETGKVTGLTTPFAAHQTYTGWTATAWLPSLISGEIKECFDVIEAAYPSGLNYYKHLAPAGCQNAP